MGLDAVVIQAGGTGKRLGGRSKPDYRVGDRRLLDILVGEIEAKVDAEPRTVVVGPLDLRIPNYAVQTLEDPPFGGPLAGVGAGVDQLRELSGAATVLLATCDAPLTPRLLPILTQKLHAEPQLDGVVPIAANAEQFPNYLQGLYRLEALRRVVIERDGSVFRSFRQLNAATVTDDEGWLIDVDTPEDGLRLEKFLDGLRG